MAKAKFKLNYVPHVGQVEVRSGIAKSNADIIVVDGSRGWGKSMFSVCDIVLPHMLSGKNKQVLWVAPSYKICKSPIDDVWFGADEETEERFIPDKCPDTGFKFWEYKRGDGEIHMFNKSKMFIRSAANPDSIVSKGYSLIVIDEAAMVSKEVFEKQILPTARRAGCKIVLISTPRGKNWFHTMFLRGQDPANKSCISFKQPWWKRPNYPKVLVELMKDLPEHIRKQEFEAEFLDSTGSTFTNIPHVFAGKEIEFESQMQEWKHPELKSKFMGNTNFIVSVDLAKINDYTVISGFCAQTNKMVWYKRFNKKDYKLVLEDIHNMAKALDYAEIIYDATGVGSSFGDFLSADFNCVPFVFTNKSKNEIVNDLIIAFDHGAIGLPNITTCRNEFEIFQFNVTRTGAMSYSAPDGSHDDVVMSVAMANWWIKENGGIMEINEVDSFLNVAGDKPISNFSDWMEQDND